MDLVYTGFIALPVVPDMPGVRGMGPSWSHNDSTSVHGPSTTSRVPG